MERNKKRRKRISQEEKMEIVRLHYLEGVSQSELARRYGTAQSVVWRIIRTFASENDKSALLMKNEPVDSQAEEIKALKAEILEQVVEAVEKAIRFYNSERPHSSIDWHTPNQAHQMSGDMKRHWRSWREDAIRVNKNQSQ